MGVKVVVPYTYIQPETEAALRATGALYETHFVGGAQDDYCTLLTGLWEAGASFVVVEHDIVVRPDTVSELAECPYGWCSFAYPYLDGLYPGLGCSKFEAQLLAQIPGAMAEVALMSNRDHEPRHWCTIDAWLRIVLQRRLVTQHVHYPPVGHIGGPYPTHDCVPHMAPKAR